VNTSVVINLAVLFKAAHSIYEAATSDYEKAKAEGEMVRKQFPESITLMVASGNELKRAGEHWTVAQAERNLRAEALLDAIVKTSRISADLVPVGSTS
jgi:hypothetical protein